MSANIIHTGELAFSSGSVAGIAVGSVGFVIFLLIVMVGIGALVKLILSRQDTKPVSKYDYILVFFH